MLSRLGHIWFSSATARLAQLGRPRGAEIRRRPCTVRAGDGCEVEYYKGEVSIALVLVLDVILLAIIYAVACVTDSGPRALTRELSEPWHPTVYRVLVPSHLFVPSCNILSCI